MAKKKPTPVITHTELLCLAFAELHSRVVKLEEASVKSPQFKEFHDEQLQSLREKQDAIRQMYLFENGSKFDWV